MSVFKSEPGVNYDTLLGGTAVVPFTANVTIASGENLKRGALLKLDATKYKAVTATDTATAVLAENVDASKGDTVATVYTRGLFNREALIVASGDTVAKHEEQLRSVGIYITSVK